MIEGLTYMVSNINNALDTKRKRHIVGGILLSSSLFLGGLAITVFTLKSTEQEEEE